jgi:hypothetical protein
MYQKQRGATFWQWLFIGGMVGVFLYVGMSLTPVYLESMSVKKALKNVESAGTALTKREVKNKILSQFQIDQVDRVGEENIKFKPLRSGKMEVSIDYDVKVPLISNLFILVEFRNKIVI